MLPFRVWGSKVQLYRFELMWQDANHVESSEYFVSEKEAEEAKQWVKGADSATAFRIRPVDTRQLEWLDNLDVGVTDNAMQEAIKIYEEGEEAHRNKDTPSTLEVLKEENRKLSARVAAQEENNKFLEDCIAEMAAQVYA